MLKIVNKKKVFILGLLFFTTSLTAQVFDKAAYEAFMITRMANKYHIQNKTVDEKFVNDIFNTLLNKLDEDKFYFIEEDVKTLTTLKAALLNDIKTKNSVFIKQVASLYQQRLQTVDSILNIIKSKKLNLSTPEILTLKENESYASNYVGLSNKINKITKLYVAKSIAYLAKEVELKTIPKAFADSLETIYRKKFCERERRSINQIQEYPNGLAQFVCNEYLSAIANVYDPHSEYFTTTQKQNFEGELGKKNMVFGFSIDENDDGGVNIKNLAPGSPAFKSGMINKGDKLIAIQWEGSKAVDVSNASLNEIGQMLSASNNSKATLTFLKSDGTKREVVLAKEINTEEEDDEKVASYILKGTKNVGYIALPSFYQDWDNEESVNGCSNDVAKEIIKLKKENIEGLIIDLRFNGGGSLQEAVDLAGLFIDAGPIAQLKTTNPKIQSIKDINRGTVYDGPLTILVNGFSASASELLAGALQDYNRAVIVGSTTYGKATGQAVLPFDTTLNTETHEAPKINGNSVKLTLLQIYQVGGKTAQFRGVVPDIILPDATEAYDKKERNEPFAIPSVNIEANKYYTKLQPLPISTLQEKAIDYKKEDPYFNFIEKYIAEKLKEKIKKDENLQLENIYKEILQDKEDDDDFIKVAYKHFTATNNNYNLEKIKANSNLKELTDNTIKRLNKDAYINMAYKLMLLMK